MMTKLKQKISTLFNNAAVQKFLTALVCALLMVDGAAAQEKAPAQWKYELQVYLWGSSMKGATVTGDEIDVGFTTIINNLDFAAMGTFSARKNKFSIVSDVIYLNLGDTIKTDKDILGRPVAAELDIGISSWVLNFGGGYELIDDGKNQLDVIAGARYLDLNLELDFELNDRNTSVTEKGHLWDGIIGISGKRTISDKWYVNYHADIGGGDSRLTWQAIVGAGYQYKKMDGVFGYRYLRWDFEKDADVFDTLYFYGPYAGLKWAF